MEQVSFILSLFFLFLLHFDLLQCYYDELSEFKTSEECKLDGICDNVENYPTDLVKELIKKLQDENTIFNYDEAPVPSINSRFYSSEEPSSLCKTRPKNMAPQLAKDVNGKFQFILNDPDVPTQVFRTAICREMQLPCSEKVGFGMGFDGKCVQKRMFRQMFFLNATKQADVGFFSVPTCCSCVLTRNNDD